jgi:hypothetical protein
MTPYLNLFHHEGRHNFRHMLGRYWRTRWWWAATFAHTLFFWT